jgi:hypothetical protein
MPSSTDLERIAYHEAGHVVATLALGGSAGAIVFRCTVNNGVEELGGSYQVPLGFQISPGGGPPDFASLIIRAAAGRVAEEIRFGHHGPGVAGDMAKINVFINGFGHSSAERDAGFPDTRDLLMERWDVVSRLAVICHRKSIRLQLPGTFPNTVILSAVGVQRIYSAPEIFAAEHGQVLEAAYHNALSRGQGSEPAYNPDDSFRDFIEAAGDFLSNL